MVRNFLTRRDAIRLGGLATTTLLAGCGILKNDDNRKRLVGIEIQNKDSRQYTFENIIYKYNNNNNNNRGELVYWSSEKISPRSFKEIMEGWDVETGEFLIIAKVDGTSKQSLRFPDDVTDIPGSCFQVAPTVDENGNFDLHFEVLNECPITSNQ
jgi:hypothetical protein